jgi:hypothetical protein
MNLKSKVMIVFLMLHFQNVWAQEIIQVKKTSQNLAKIENVNSEIWKAVPETKLNLLAQMMVRPRPANVETQNVQVQLLHDGKYMAFRFRWKDTEPSEGGKLAEFSDALAIEFPVLDNLNPPPIFMGIKDNPVHMFHWRFQYQHDQLHGKKEIQDIYPNMSVDAYPLEFKDMGSILDVTEEKKDVFSHARAAQNPQAFAKRAVDEIMAEGFGSSAAREDFDSNGFGEWENGEWTLVISRALKRPNGSVLTESGQSSFGVAVWQGGKDEVGSRKSITMLWTPFVLEK